MLIVQRDGCFVEVQIRTRLQHRWAETFEKLADLAGRQVRYAEPASDERHQTLVDIMLSLSGTIAAIEDLRRRLAKRERAVISLQRDVSNLPGEVPEARDLVRRVDALLESVAQDRQELEETETTYFQRLDAIESVVDSLKAHTDSQP